MFLMKYSTTVTGIFWEGCAPTVAVCNVVQQATRFSHPIPMSTAQIAQLSTFAMCLPAVDDVAAPALPVAVSHVAMPTTTDWQPPLSTEQHQQ